jgi:nickel/cobalt exporter
MGEAFLYLASSFWNGAVHAATPGHGKTIAAAYIVGVRGRPADAWILGVFVTLSHTSGIVLVGVLAALGLPGMMPQRIEAWMALATGLLVIGIGLWSVWTQRRLMSIALSQNRTSAPDGAGAPTRYRAVAHDHGDGAAYVQGHTHTHAHGHDHDHGDDPVHGAGHTHHHEEAGFHTHGWGFRHTHDMSLVTTRRPSLWMLLGLGIAGGLVPDPLALGILLSLLAQGKVMLGLATVLIFSLGFASVLVVVGVVAAKVGPKILDWLSGPWAARLQVATSLLIVAVGVVLSVNAWRLLSRLA